MTEFSAQKTDENLETHACKTIVSKHVFLFPFKFDYKKTQKIFDAPLSRRADIEEVKLLLDDNWISEFGGSGVVDVNKMDFQYNYNAYFYESVKKAMKSDEIDKYPVVNNYYYNIEKGDTFEIYTKNKMDTNQGNTNVNKIKVFNLSIEKIALKIYETGVGILSFSLDNYDEATTNEDVLVINDLGRRVYPQFFPLEEAKKCLLSDKIRLNLQDGKKIISEDFQRSYDSNSLYISKTIMELLGINFKYSNAAQREVEVKPIIDDRMYTMCFYMNDDKSRILNQVNGDCYNWCKDEYWNKYIFIDGYGLTCQSNKMLKELNSNHTYHRWANYGTLYGITRYSFVGISSTGWVSENLLLNHFRYLYYEMVCLTLAQRASILRFDDEVSRLSAIDRNNNKPFSTENDTMLKFIKDLQLNYIHFINRIHFREVTAQEQGIELYNMMMESMNIEKEIDKLDDEIDELHRYAQLSAEDKTNTMLTILTIVGTIIATSSFIVGFFGMSLSAKGELPIISQITNLKYWGVNYLLIPITTIFMLIGVFNLALNKVNKKILYFIFIFFLLILLVLLK